MKRGLEDSFRRGIRGLTPISLASSTCSEEDEFPPRATVHILSYPGILSMKHNLNKMNLL